MKRHFAVISVLLCCSLPAQACVLSNTSIADTYKKANSAFVARVVSVEYMDAVYGLNGFKSATGQKVEIATVVVEKAWKGATVGESIVIRSTDGTSCDRFLLGDPKRTAEKWLIYGYEDQQFYPQPTSLMQTQKDMRALDRLSHTTGK